VKKNKEVYDRAKDIEDRLVFSVTYFSYNYGFSKHFKYKKHR